MLILIENKEVYFAWKVYCTTNWRTTFIYIANCVCGTYIKNLITELVTYAWKLFSLLLRVSLCVFWKICPLTAEFGLRSLICICMIRLNSADGFVNTKTKYKITYFWCQLLLHLSRIKKCDRNSTLWQTGHLGVNLCFDSQYYLSIWSYSQLSFRHFICFYQLVLFSYSLLLRISRMP